MTALRTEVWFVIKRDGTIVPSFTAVPGALGPYDLIFDTPQEVDDAATEQADRLRSEREDRAARSIRGRVSRRDRQ